MVKYKKKDDDILYRSFYKIGKVIAEQCYDGSKVFFAVWDGNDVSYRDELEDGIIIKPIAGQEVTKRAILLPTKAEEYESDDKLDNEILSFIDKWLDIPTDVKQFALWNIKRSWVYDRFHTLNYLRALGDTGVGKTRFLDVLGHIHYKAIATSGATTAAPIFRIIEKWHGTLIMDEADFGKSDESQDIIKIINMGYEKGKHVMRCDVNDPTKIDLFDPYCPKILATRQTFSDKAVESRCITQVMQETARQDIPYNLNDEFFLTTQRLRNKLLMWRFRNYYKVDQNKKVDLGLDLEPRVKQIVNSFVSLFADNVPELEKFKIFMQNYQEELIDERRGSFNGLIVNSIHGLLEKGQTNITAQDIIDEGDIRNSKGNLVSPRGLTSILKSLGFGKTSMQRIDGIVKRLIPLNLKILTNLFKRYGNDVTVITVITGVAKNTKEYPFTHPGALRTTVTTDASDTIVTDIFMDSKQIKDTLISLFSLNSEVEIQEFLTKFPSNFHESVGIILDRMKSDGEIFEPKPGFIKML